MSGLFRLQAATAVVDVATVMSHLRVTDAGEQLLIETYLNAATRLCQQHTNRAIGQQRWLLSLAGFTTRTIRLPLPPLVSVETVKYLDLNGVRKTLDAANYYVDIFQFLGEVSIKPGFNWPDTLCRSDAVQIEFTCGTTAIDGDIIGAILLLCGHFYENREAVTGLSISELPFGVCSLLSPHVVPVCP